MRALQESETVATIVAMRLAGYPADITGEGVRVLSVLPESPASTRLLPGDQIIALNEEPIQTVGELTAHMRSVNPLGSVTLTVLRADQQVTVTTLVMSPSSPTASPRLGVVVETVGMDAKLPFPVVLEPHKIVGGPSAGLMFTLAIYDLLTPGDLASGHQIAGTGTISLEGRVGPIGGVAQKVAGAERAGATYFLVPAENYDDAQQAARRIKVLKVATVEEAIKVLQALH